MKSLLTKVETILSGLSWAAAYDNPAGGTIAMRAYTGAMPPKRESAGQGEDFPYRFTWLDGFDLTRHGMRYTVATEIGIYEAGSISDAITLVDSIITIIKPLPSKIYAPFKLLESEITGDLSKANHPFYTITLNMTFREIN